MITRDLKLYFFLACIPAFVLTAVALVQLHRLTSERERETRAKALEEVHRIASSSVFAGVEGEHLNSLVMRSSQFRAKLDELFGQKPSAGAFVWRARSGIVCTNDVPPEVLKAIDGIGSLGAWSTEPRHKKKPPNSDICRLAGYYVVWARDVRRNGYLCGVVFKQNPKAAGFAFVATWPIVVALGAMLVIVFAGGAWLLVRAATKARRDDMMKTTFLSNASHELKTPLAGIGVWADLLRGGRLPAAKQAHAYDVIASENARMLRLVENLLDFSRLEQGRRRYHPRALDLAVLAADVVDLVRGDFAEHGITLKADEDVTAWADADATKQILVNLLGNAAKYAAAGGPVEVVVSQEESRVRVAVLDRGPGMSDEARAHAFERFWRADTDLTAATGGLGLGLSISDALAKDMDGRLSVAAREGGGCVFVLELPHASHSSLQ